MDDGTQNANLLGDNREASIFAMNQARSAEADFQRYLLDDETELLQLEMSWSGKLWDPLKKTWKPGPKDFRKMSDEAARNVVWGYLYNLKNSKLSRFNEEEIRELMMFNMQELNKHFHIKSEEYEMSVEDIGYILNQIETFLKSLFNRAYQGMEQERLRETTRNVTEQRTNLAPGSLGDGMEQNPNYIGSKQKKWYNLWS